MLKEQENLMKNKLLFYLVSVFIFNTSVISDDKIIVTSSDQLPRYTYVLKKKPSQVLQDQEAINFLRNQVFIDLKNELNNYDIRDKSTLRSHNILISQLYMLKKDYKFALNASFIAENLAEKESEKLLTGLLLRSRIEAEKKISSDLNFEDVFISEYEKRIQSLKWNVVEKDIKSLAGRLRILSPQLILGQIQSSIDPIVDIKLEVSHEIARSLVSSSITLEYVLPLKKKILNILNKFIEKNSNESRPEIWSSRGIEFTGKEPYQNILIAIWDSGVDVNVFEELVWTNQNEILDGKDNDQNGFIDDINGIAWDINSDPAPNLLHSIENLKSERQVVLEHTKGLMDLQASIGSKEAEKLQIYISNLESDNVGSFLEDLSLFGNYIHGTHVAGISMKGNPFARVTPIRLTFDYKSIPSVCPTDELIEKSVRAFAETVNYFKKIGVRVVNMSWGGSRADIESTLEKCKIGNSSKERADLARKYFSKQKSAMEEAIRKASEILFVTSAGNSNNDVSFDEMIPSGIKSPNLIVVGAVDHSGSPTSFTSFGSNVDVYANGFEIESFIPGGSLLKASGTSMSSPQVTNLAGKILTIAPNLSPKDIKKIIVDTSNRSYYDSNILLVHPKRAIAKVNSIKEDQDAPKTIDEFSVEDQQILKKMIIGLNNINDKEILDALKSQLEMQAKQEDKRQKYLALFTIEAINNRLLKIQNSE